MHNAAHRFIEQQVASRGPFRRVVEIGARNVNGSVRPLFGDARYIGVDVTDGPGVDVVEDGGIFWPTGDASSPDCVVCCETLEHALNAEHVVDNMRAMVAPGGLILITCAGPGRRPHSAIDGNRLRDGEHYRNIEPSELGGWLLGLAELLVMHDPGLGDLYAVAVKP